MIIKVLILATVMQRLMVQVLMAIKFFGTGSEKMRLNQAGKRRNRN